MTKHRIAEENTAAEDLLPPKAPDGSGIGVNYVDAYIKPMNVAVEDGPKVACKRKGLKIILSVNDQTGEVVMRRTDHGPDPRSILRKALESAATAAGANYVVEDGAIFLEV
ncbi:MAG: hypothetical protein KDA44_13030 [Planctomycetales bacterium]|nr:hypothetical protein [Planctomycetales bacterium]